MPLWTFLTAFDELTRKVHTIVYSSDIDNITVFRYNIITKEGMRHSDGY